MFRSSSGLTDVRLTSYLQVRESADQAGVSEGVRNNGDAAGLWTVIKRSQVSTRGALSNIDK